LIEYDKPSSYQEVVTGDADDWKRAIDKELQVYELNDTCTFENFSEGRKTLDRNGFLRRNMRTQIRISTRLVYV